LQFHYTYLTLLGQERRDSIEELMNDIAPPGDLFDSKKAITMKLAGGALPDGFYHIHNGVVSAHPEIFKVKMLAKKNVKTISTMSSSNYDNSDNSSNLGGKN